MCCVPCKKTKNKNGGNPFLLGVVLSYRVIVYDHSEGFGGVLVGVLFVQWTLLRICI